MKRTILLLFLLLPTFAAIQDLRITSTLNPPISHERIVFELYNDLNSPVNSAFFSLPSDAQSIRVEDSYGELSFTTEKVSDTIKLTYEFSVPINSGEKRLIIVEYETQEILRKKNLEWEFLMVFLPTSKFNIEHTLQLPAGHVPKVISPQAEIKELEDRTQVIWNLESNGEDSIVFITRFTAVDEEINWMLVGVAAVLLIIVFVLGILFQKSMAELAKRKKLGAVKIVKDEDRKILEMVINQPGIRQNEIQESLNWSKASISKRVTNLIGQGLLQKKKRGRRNYLYPGPKFA
jgi:uncharacterized membrane protein